MAKCRIFFRNSEGNVSFLMLEINHRLFSAKQQDSPTNRKQDQYEDWPSTASAGGLLISGDFLPMIHKFEDLFENSSAMMHFMTFLDSLGWITILIQILLLFLGQQHLLKFYIHVEGFKSATNYKGYFNF